MINIELFRYLNNFALQSALLDQVVIFTAVTFGNLLIAVAIIFLFVRKIEGENKNPLQLFRVKVLGMFFVFFASGFAWLTSKILKIIIQSPRPFDMLSGVHVLFPETGYGFPSSHAVSFSALAVSLWLIDRRIGIIYAISALLIGLARIIGGVHFPLDILGGFILGSIITLATYWVGKKLLK
ncbi:MAG: phosphatase PAP2 family protein [Candidatus Paceibacterota bacterium]|jgi:undecaprenyl-diphosphatase